MERLSQKGPYLLLGFTLLLFVLFVGLFSNESKRIQVASAEELNTEWVLGSESITLPTRVDAEVGEIVSIERVLPTAFNAPQVLLIRTSLQDVVVRLDGVIIYESSFSEEIIYASMWHYVEVPSNQAGGVLSIAYSTPYNGMRGVLNPVLYGDQLSLYRGLVSLYGYRLLVGFMTLLIGLFMMSVGTIFYRKQNIGNVQLGLFSVFLSLWIISEARLLQLFTGNIFLIGSLSYIMLCVMPIPVLSYFKDHVIKHNRKLLCIPRALFYVWLGVVIVLQLSGLYAFFETVIFTQFFIFLSIVLSVVLMFIELFKYKDTTVKRPLLMTMLLSLFLLFEAVTFILGQFDVTSLFAVTAVALFMIILLTYFIRFMRIRFIRSYEREIYEKLAYVDTLTQGHNRLAYEQDFEALFHSDKALSDLRLTMFDLDDLKHINDTFGHLEGDAAIISTYALIQEVFGVYGYSYRIGGDEFAHLSNTMSDAQFKESIIRFESRMKDISKGTPYPFRISLGMALFNEKTDEKPSDMMKRADDLMYKNKQLKTTT